MDAVKSLIDKVFAQQLNSYCIKLSTVPQDSLSYTSIPYRAIVEGYKQGSKVTYSLFIKLAVQETYYRSVLPIKQLYEREIFVLNNVIPKVKKFCKDKNVKEQFHPFVEAYCTVSDEGKEAIVLDDMNSKSFTVASSTINDYPHAALVLKTLGKFHAVSYAFRDQHPETFKSWEINTSDNFYNSVIKPVGIQTITEICQKILKCVDIDYKKEKEVIQKFLKNLPDIFTMYSSSERKDKYSVITHGDLQMRNLLFKYSNSSDPTELCMVDWQLSKIGSPALDILYFFAVSYDKCLRRKYFQLVEEYHQSLSTFLRQLGSDPDLLLPIHVLHRQLKQHAPFALLNALWMIPINVQKRDFKSSSDTDLWVKEVSDGPHQHYVTIICDLIKDFVEYGYFE